MTSSVVTPATSTRDLAAPVAARPPGFGAALAAVYVGQLSRARVARVPLLFVATLQSVGILLLLRGVVGRGDATAARHVVAGSTVLVVAFVAVNLLAQRLGALRAARALDYYAALPVSAGAVVLGTAASFASFTLPGAVVTALSGVWLYGLPVGRLWLLVAVLVTAGAALAGAGAAIGLLAPKPELATVGGQLAMTAVLFLGIIAPDRMPAALQVIRLVVPGTAAADAFARSFTADPDWLLIGRDLLITAVLAVAGLACAAVAFRRAVQR